MLAATGSASDPASVLERLGAHWRAAATRSRLVPAGPAARLVPPGTATGLVPTDTSAVAAHLIVGTVPATLIPDRLAHTAVEFLRTADLGRLRACPVEHGGCGWLFLDRSRNGSRRWCAMADCGTQTKSRRLTERRRSARITG